MTMVPSRVKKNRKSELDFAVQVRYDYTVLRPTGGQERIGGQRVATKNQGRYRMKKNVVFLFLLFMAVSAIATANDVVSVRSEEVVQQVDFDPGGQMTPPGVIGETFLSVSTAESQQSIGSVVGCTPADFDATLMCENATTTSDASDACGAAENVRIGASEGHKFVMFNNQYDGQDGEPQLITNSRCQRNSILLCFSGFDADVSDFRGHLVRGTLSNSETRTNIAGDATGNESENRQRRNRPILWRMFM